MSYRPWERSSRTWGPIFAATGVVSLWRSLLRGLIGKTTDIGGHGWRRVGLEEKTVLYLDILQLCRRVGGGCHPNVFRLIDPLVKAGSHIGGLHYDAPCWLLGHQASPCRDKRTNLASIRCLQRGPSARVKRREQCPTREAQVFRGSARSAIVTARCQVLDVHGAGFSAKRCGAHLDARRLSRADRVLEGVPCGATSMLQCKSSLRS